MIYGAGRFQFRVVEGWGYGPQGRTPGGRVPCVAVDSQDRVYVIVRAPAPVLVYDREGRFLTAWGAGLFDEPHGVWRGPDDHIYVADRVGHTIREFTTEGALLRTLGTHGQAGAAGKPFNSPNDLIVAPSGEIFVADGGNYCVHKLAPDGSVLLSWGERGVEPGQFNFPHSIELDRRGRVLVTDRENNRVQIFSPAGEYLDAWTIPKPNDIFIDGDGSIYVTEEEKRKVDVFNEAGELLARWGEPGDAPGQFKSFVHSLWLDSRGDLYVTEVLQDNRVQKFERVK